MMESIFSELNQKLLDAHAQGNKLELANLYYTAAKSCEDKDIDETCFFLTQAYVFALELGLDTTDELHQLLVQHNRES